MNIDVRKELKLMNVNGIIMQKKSRAYYQGIEGDNWYLNYEYSKELDKFFEENIEMAWRNSDYVDACNNMEYIQKYIDISKKNNVNYRILLCMTEKNQPKMKLPEEDNIIFLGYDYAYTGGSYYSAVLNDIISKRIPQFSKMKLNENGLFKTYEDIIDFISLRESIKKTSYMQDNLFEKGDFTVYKLYEICNHSVRT